MTIECVLLENYIEFLLENPLYLQEKNIELNSYYLHEFLLYYNFIDLDLYPLVVAIQDGCIDSDYWRKYMELKT